MAQVRDILIHVEVEVAKAKRICHHKRNEHSISKGIVCLTIRDDTGGHKNYCLPCAHEILTKAKSKLANFEQQLK
jgi:hypothetical protein